MKGKEKCEFLKGIRKRMAEANGIPYEPRKCDYKGECSGTCPACEKEAEYLMAALKEKEANGVEIVTDSDYMRLIEQEEMIKNLEETKPLMGDVKMDYHDVDEDLKEALRVLRSNIEGDTGTLSEVNPES